MAAAADTKRPVRVDPYSDDDVNIANADFDASALR